MGIATFKDIDCWAQLDMLADLVSACHKVVSSDKSTTFHMYFGHAMFSCLCHLIEVQTSKLGVKLTLRVFAA